MAKISEPIAITDRSAAYGILVDESFKMGPYAVTDVVREFHPSSEISVLGFSSWKHKDGFAYVFKGEEEKRKGGCVTEESATVLSLKGGGGVSDGVWGLGCRCLIGDREAKLMMQTATGSGQAGTVEAGRVHYRIVGIYESEGTLRTRKLSGYRVDGDGPAGAVEVLRPGRVWMSRDLVGADRADLACLFAGLLLYSLPSNE